MQTPDTLLATLDLDRLLQEDAVSIDLRQGVIFNPGRTRLCLLSADLLGGVHRALVEEAGPAWSLIFKHCGRIWGERLARRLDRECRDSLGVRMEEMMLSDFVRFVTAYFAFHGWGRLALEVDRAEETGIVTATMVDSIFAAVVQAPGEMVDPMIAGILASLLSHLADHELDCVQTACVTLGAPASRFVVTDPERLRQAEPHLRRGTSHDELLLLL